MIQTITCDPTTGLGIVVTNYVGLTTDPEAKGPKLVLEPNEVICTAQQAASPGSWVLSPGTNGAPASLVAATAEQMAKPIPQLAAAMITAASAACAAVTKQVVPDAVHQTAYTNALALVGPSATVPTNDPAKTAFAAMASANGFASNLQAFATLAVNVASASLTLSGLQTTLQAAASEATSSTQLASALTTFESGMTSLVQSLNQAGLTISVNVPDPITIVGINA